MMNVNKIHKSSFSIFLSLISFLFVVAFSYPLYGQLNQKKDLKPSEYHLWGSVRLERISPDEKWASYNMLYENGVDTLFVKNIQNQSTYSFANGTNGIFTNNMFFICQIKDGIVIQNLRTGKNETESGIKRFSYCKETDQIITVRGIEEHRNVLIIRSLGDGKKQEITNVTNFSLSPKGHHLLYEIETNNKKVIAIVDLKKANEPRPIVTDSVDSFDDYTWQKEGGAIAFTGRIDQKHGNLLFYYIVATDKLYKLDPNLNYNLSMSGSLRPKIISDDLQKVFFSIQAENNSFNKAKTKPEVEIWNANDEFTYKKQSNIENFNLSPTIVMWLPHSDQIKQVTSTALPDLIVTGNFEHAILSNPRAYEPQFEQYGPRDFYIMDLKTSEKKLVLKEQPYDPRYPSTSPSGKYFVYFKGKDWWVYDILAKTHTNVTALTGSSFIGKQVGELVPESAYGNPGWTKDDKEIMLYDQYDLWAITPDGKTFRRLTRGRELGVKYRIAREPSKIFENVMFSGLVVDSFDLSKDLFLFARGDDEKTGYFRWNAKTGERRIVYGDSYVNELNYNGSAKKIFYSEQRFDLSPRLMSADNSLVSAPIFKSNVQQHSYHWGKSELISYYNSKGTRLKGALFYPANYDPNKKYPMIVHIYEFQSSKLHRYQNPNANKGSLNVTHLTNQGYFVLLPDILLLEGNPGISAADCTIAATKSVIEKGLVEPSKIGLMGHSFGGYETAFIITQTNLFAAAIASGGITDLVSFYHTINPHTGEPDMWRFRNQQWNMGGTPYELPELYKANSPIAQVQNIRTPVLLWTGKSDGTVDPHQTMELYLALRRLGKKAIMLLYPNQGHALMDPDYQKDLSNRVIEWFDYYLKGEKTANWIANGIGTEK